MTTAVGIFSLITAGKIRAAFAGTDFNLAQEVTSTIRAGVLEGLLLFSLIEPGFGETVLVSFWLIFQCMTDSHLSPLRWSHLVKVTVAGSDVLMSVRGRHLWLWNVYQQPDRAKPATLAAVCAFSHFFRED